jgi:chemotaxis protein CheC
MQLTPPQMDALTEMINIGVGKAASILNQMVQAPVTLTVPSIKVLEAEAAIKELSSQGACQVAAVTMQFQGRLGGNTTIFFTPQNAAKLANVLIGGDMQDLDLDSIKIGALTEVGNILLNSVIGSISNIVREKITFKVPVYEDRRLQDIMLKGLDENQRVVVVAETFFDVKEHSIRGETLLILGVNSFDSLIGTINMMMQQQDFEST